MWLKQKIKTNTVLKKPKEGEKLVKDRFGTNDVRFNFS